MTRPTVVMITTCDTSDCRVAMALAELAQNERHRHTIILEGALLPLIESLLRSPIGMVRDDAARCLQNLAVAERPHVHELRVAEPVIEMMEVRICDACVMRVWCVCGRAYDRDALACLVCECSASQTLLNCIQHIPTHDDVHRCTPRASSWEASKANPCTRGVASSSSPAQKSPAQPRDCRGAHTRRA